jgi:hypothetical protein
VLVRLLTADAAALTATGGALASAPLPQEDPQPTVHLAALREDLAPCSDGLSSLLWEIIAGLHLDTLGGTPPPSVSVSYLRVRRLLETVGRAEQWLEVIDHETGAHATLPGFERGAPSLEEQLTTP